MPLLPSKAKVSTNRHVLRFAFQDSLNGFWCEENLQLLLSRSGAEFLVRKMAEKGELQRPVSANGVSNNVNALSASFANNALADIWGLRSTAASSADPTLGLKVTENLLRDSMTLSDFYWRNRCSSTTLIAEKLLAMRRIFYALHQKYHKRKKAINVRNEDRVFQRSLSNISHYFRAKNLGLLLRTR